MLDVAVTVGVAFQAVASKLCSRQASAKTATLVDVSVLRK